MRREKRRPGGQPGNRNAHKHGFYGRGVGPTLRNALKRAKTLSPDELVEEVALARARLSELLTIEPENHDILIRMLSTITRIAAVNHAMSPAQERQLGQAMQELLAELLPDREI